MFEFLTLPKWVDFLKNILISKWIWEKLKKQTEFKFLELRTM